MIQQHSKVFVRESAFGKLASFMESTLVNLCNEMNLTADAFFTPTEFDDKDCQGSDKIFSAIERTWVGMFNNALVRNNPNVATLQEFGVYPDKVKMKRCDLLFRVSVDNTAYDVIVEAKASNHKPNWKVTEQKDYKKTLEQAYTYYETDRNYYQHQVCLMIIRFECIRDSNSLMKAKDVMENWKDTDDEETDFLTLYYGNNRGIFVYGKIIPTSEYELSIVKSQAEFS